MLLPLLPRLAPVVLALAALPAAAQSEPTQAPQGGGDGFVRSTPIENYKPFSDEPLIPWKDANDNVGRIGGWREYAREARPATAPSSAPATQPRSGTGNQHGNH
jgi:hypothetical protein